MTQFRGGNQQPEKTVPDKRHVSKCGVQEPERKCRHRIQKLEDGEYDAIILGGRS